MSHLFRLFLILFPVLAFAAPLPVEQVVPGVYVHHGEHKDLKEGYGGDICNVGFIVGDKGVAVIDTGGSPKIGGQLREAVRKVTKLPILYVINTHVHPDHSLGNAAFKRDKPVFVGHGKLAEAMAQRKEVYLRNQRAWVGADAARTELIPPDLPVGVTHDIDLGGRSLRLTAYPLAHSPTDMTVFDSASGTLWTGDLLFIERTPSIDGSLAGWLDVIEQLRAVPAHRVVPGHGSSTSDLLAALDNEIAFLVVQRGDSLEQTIATAAQSEQGRWLLFDIVNRRNVAMVFPMLEWE